MNAFLSLPFMVRLVIAILLSGAIAFFTTPFVKWMAYKVGAVDVPKDNRRMHDHPIPRLGGLAIAIAFILTSALCVPLDKELQGIMLGGIIILVLGVLDDSLTLPALPKFFVQIVAAIVVVAHGVTIQRFTNPFAGDPYASFDLGFLAAPITVIWIVMLTNAVNFIDGLDGLAVGVSGISALCILIIALLVSEEDVALIMAAVFGSCMGFIPYNKNPAQIFMGDTGSTFLGFILACMSIQGMFKMYAVISFAVPFLVLGIPIFDICFAVIRRLAKHQNPMVADREHLHHRLIDMGLSQKQTVAVAYTLTGVLGFAAVLLTQSGEMRTLILLCAVAVVVALAILVIYGPAHRPNQNKDKVADQEGKGK